MQDSESSRPGRRGSAQLFVWSLTSALAGFLFGFDTVVISGAEQKIQSMWSLSPGMHGVAIASALYGTVAGSLLGGWPTDRFGRKKTLLIVGLLYIVSAVWSAFAHDVYAFTAARVLGGIAIGISTVAAPLYIAEIAPSERRGMLTAMFQLNIVTGIVAAYASNAFLGHMGEDAWRWMIGVAAIPSTIYTLMCLIIPESPRWIFAKGDKYDEGLALLRRVRPGYSEERIQAEARDIVDASRSATTRGSFWSKSLSRPILLAFLIAFFNQLSGINAVLYFAPRIFDMAGFAQQAALMQSVGIGVTIMLFTFVGVMLIDRIGRRRLLYIGSVGYIGSLALIAWAFFSQNYAIVPTCIFIYVAAHAVGQGTVIWVYISEIFPDRFRAEGQALGSFTHWAFAALITTFFPLAAAHFHPGYIFVFFCVMMLLQLLWVRTMVVETKKVPLEQMQRQFGLPGADVP